MDEHSPASNDSRSCGSCSALHWPGMPAFASSFTICGISGCSDGRFGRAADPGLTLTLLIVTGLAIGSGVRG